MQRHLLFCDPPWASANQFVEQSKVVVGWPAAFKDSKLTRVGPQPTVPDLVLVTPVADHKDGVGLV
jgi:hypothetical protein